MSTTLALIVKKHQIEWKISKKLPKSNYALDKQLGEEQVDEFVDGCYVIIQFQASVIVLRFNL